MNGMIFDNRFPTKYSYGCDHYMIHLLCGNYMSPHCSMLSTSIKDTMHSISYLTGEKFGYYLSD